MKRIKKETQNLFHFVHSYIFLFVKHFGFVSVIINSAFHRMKAVVLFVFFFFLLSSYLEFVPTRNPNRVREFISPNECKLFVHRNWIILSNWRYKWFETKYKRCRSKWTKMINECIKWNNKVYFVFFFLIVRTINFYWRCFFPLYGFDRFSSQIKNYEF